MSFRNTFSLHEFNYYPIAKTLEFYELAIQALEEEDEIEVAEQDKKIAKYNKQISDKKNQLDSLRRSVYRGLITDHAFFLSEQGSINADIDALIKARDSVMTAANNWREKANDILCLLDMPKKTLIVMIGREREQ